MRVSLELFLLDNVLMNLLMLRLAYALIGVRPYLWRMWGAAVFGAVAAALSVTRLPVLAALIPKLLLGAVMALPLMESRRTYLKALLCLYLSACIMGGVMFAFVFLLGGGFYSGALMGTVPVRIALLAACGCALLPRLMTALTRSIRHRAGYVRLIIRVEGRRLDLRALVDTGNLLVEPISNLPVIVIRPGLLPAYEGRPVPYRTVDGTGLLYAILPDEVFIFQGYWHRAAAVVAEGRQALQSADAIVGGNLLSDERWCVHARTETDFEADLSAAVDAAAESAAVYPLGGNASAPVWTGGGAGVDRAPDA